jgi:NAD-dependent deacetylase
VPHDIDDALERAADSLRQAQSICVLTGAGVSAESGVPTFRDSNGLWEGHRIEDVATPRGWHRNPQLVWEFYHQRWANATQVKPNLGHHALARMEQHWSPDHFTIATQNVDGLHQTAGNKNVLELHGSLQRVRCTECGTTTDRNPEPMTGIPECPDCGGALRPDIVWFGEMLPQRVWKTAELAAQACDAFLVVGTSAVVFPAAGLIQTARNSGTKPSPAIIIECNLTRTDASQYADVGLYGPSGETLPRLCKRLGI